MEDRRQLTNAGPGFLFDSMDQEGGAMDCSDGLGIMLDFSMLFFGIAADAEVHIERVGTIAELKEDVPEGKAVLAAGDRDQDAIFGLKHGQGLNGARDLFVNKSCEADLAECGIMPGKADDGFGLTFSTIHDDPYRTMRVGSQPLSTAGDDWPDFDPVGIRKHFIFRDEVVATNHQVRFHDEVEFAQQILRSFGTLDFDLA